VFPKFRDRGTSILEKPEKRGGTLSQWGKKIFRHKMVLTQEGREEKLSPMNDKRGKRILSVKRGKKGSERRSPGVPCEQAPGSLIWAGNRNVYSEVEREKREIFLFPGQQKKSSSDRARLCTRQAT